MRRFRFDRSVHRYGSTLVGGSPLRLFRTTRAGGAVLDAIGAGRAVGPSRLVDRLLDAGAVHPVAAAGGRWTAADVTVVTPTLGSAPPAVPGAIVVDDASPEPVAGATVRLDRRSGPGAARNAGLELVTTRLVAFVDADVELADGWLAPLLPHFDDDRVALVAPRVASAPGPSLLERYEASHSPLDLGPEPARIQPGSRVSYVPAAVVVGRTDAIRALGGFDQSLRFGEDVDLVWRLVDAGWRCRYEPGSVAHHAPRPGWAAWLRQRVGYGSSAAPLALRHPGRLAPLRASAWSVGAWLLAIAGRPGLGAFVGAGSAAALPPKLPDVPPAAAIRLAARGHLAAGDQIARAVRRAWWPLLLAAAPWSRTARRALLAAAVAARHPLRLADDVAYAVGVWCGCARWRTVAPLWPDLSSWPGRGDRGEDTRYRATA